MVIALLLAFSCTAINHLGLVAAVETTLSRWTRRDIEIPVINCPKCLTFWAVLTAGFLSSAEPVGTLALALLMAWLARWLNLFMGAVDVLYDKIYETLYNAGGGDNPLPAGRQEDTTAGLPKDPFSEVPDLW